jgi:hypothetical protein
MIVVGLSGYAGAGKDAVADILVRDHGFTKMAFADPIKRMVRALDPVVGYEPQGVYCDCDECASTFLTVHLSELYDEMGLTEAEIKKSEFGDEVRRLWQRFGTEVIREMDEDYWVKLAMAELGKTTADRIVFTDVRFENEADFIFDLSDDGFYNEVYGLALVAEASSVWRVARPNQHPDDVHASEQMIGLLGEQVTILNDGSLEDLKEPVAIAMDMLLNHVIPGQDPFEMDGWE